MAPSDGVPWRPPPLDEYLNEPFEQIEEQQKTHFLDRLDEMTRRLEDMEEELDVFLHEFAECP
ncbi:MAG: hypothetical protein WCY01_04440 [Alkalispirochaeta sp.]|jgi:hypothetical protein